MSGFDEGLSALIRARSWVIYMNTEMPEGSDPAFEWGDVEAIYRMLADPEAVHNPACFDTFVRLLRRDVWLTSRLMGEARQDLESLTGLADNHSGIPSHKFLLRLLAHNLENPGKFTKAGLYADLYQKITGCEPGRHPYEAQRKIASRDQDVQRTMDENRARIETKIPEFRGKNIPVYFLLRPDAMIALYESLKVNRYRFLHVLRRFGQKAHPASPGLSQTQKLQAALRSLGHPQPPRG